MITYADVCDQLGIPSLIAKCPQCQRKFAAWRFTECFECKVPLEWPVQDAQRGKNPQEESEK